MTFSKKTGKSEADHRSDFFCACSTDNFLRICEAYARFVLKCIEPILSSLCRQFKTPSYN